MTLESIQKQAAAQLTTEQVTALLENHQKQYADDAVDHDDCTYARLCKMALGFSDAVALLVRRTEALEQAVTLIKAWHNMSGRWQLEEALEEKAWEIYYNHSPEMKPIREARAALKEGV